MKQKLAVARALLPDPQVLLLDEPTANLDPVSIRKLKDLIRQMAAEGRTIVYCSHTLSEIDELCDRFAILNKKLLRLGTPEELRQEWAEFNVTMEVAEDSSKAIQILQSSSRVVKCVQEGNLIHLRVQDPLKDNPVLVQRLVQEGVLLSFVQRSTYTLEDAYLALLEAEKGNE
jgi:ABC-2 type transport system ATP-binding protein